MEPLRILLVDDHPLFREGLARLFAYVDDIEVVGEAGDARTAVELTRSLAPDLVLMDVELPKIDGVAATRQLTLEQPEVAVVMLTAYDDTDRLLDAIKAGARGYLVKNMRSTELLDQLRGFRQGEAAISRRMATRLLEEFRRSSDVETPEADLTAREIDVLTLVSERLTNKEIALRLVLSEHTVKNHLKNILAKLHLRSRRHAAAYGLAHGLIHSGAGPRLPETN